MTCHILQQHFFAARSEWTGAVKDGQHQARYKTALYSLKCAVMSSLLHETQMGKIEVTLSGLHAAHGSPLHA